MRMPVILPRLIPVLAVAAGLLALAGVRPAAADCVEPARGDGRIRAEMGRVELSGDERMLIEERFAPDFAEAARLGLAADALFRFARCDLNGDAPDELVAVGRSPAHCGAETAAGPEVCGLWALAQTPEGWVQVLETTGEARLTRSTTNGWRDVVVERGGAPVVFKYGGAVYQEDLGDADFQPFALDDYGGYGQGPTGILWYAFDDPMPEAVESAFLWFYASEIRGAEGRIGVLPDAFRVGAVDLDEDGAEEAVIQGISPDFCSVEGCQHWVLTNLGRESAPAIAGRLVGFDLQAAATGGRAGRDLVAATAHGLIVYRNDGEGWGRP